jgi:hypothetical protein
MSAAARRPASVRRSITDFQSQIALFTSLGAVDSSADPVGAFGQPFHVVQAVDPDEC